MAMPMTLIATCSKIVPALAANREIAHEWRQKHADAEDAKRLLPALDQRGEGSDHSRPCQSSGRNRVTSKAITPKCRARNGARLVLSLGLKAP